MEDATCCWTIVTGEIVHRGPKGALLAASTIAGEVLLDLKPGEFLELGGRTYVRQDRYVDLLCVTLKSKPRTWYRAE